MSTASENDDRMFEIAEHAFAVARGSVRQVPPPELYALAWDDLTDEQRTLYVHLVRAGFDAARQ